MARRSGASPAIGHVVVVSGVTASMRASGSLRAQDQRRARPSVGVGVGDGPAQLVILALDATAELTIHRSVEDLHRAYGPVGGSVNRRRGVGEDRQRGD